jgi:hypothetical protein
MPNDSSRHDPITIWKNQPTEPSTMTLLLIRSKVRELRARTRRESLGTLAGPIAVGAFYGFAIKEFHGFAPALELVFAFAILWSLAGLYFLNRGMWSRAMPGDAALSTGLEFYRRELERRQRLFRRALGWSLGPILLAIATFILYLAMVGGARFFPNGLPFLALVVLWIAAYFAMRMRGQRELQREIDELNEIESADGST